jgi:hypothetical protein
MRYQTLGLVEGFLIFVALRQETRSPAPLAQRIVNGEATPWIVSARKAIKNEEEIYWSSRKG